MHTTTSLEAHIKCLADTLHLYTQTVIIAIDTEDGYRYVTHGDTRSLLSLEALLGQRLRDDALGLIQRINTGE